MTAATPAKSNARGRRTGLLGLLAAPEASSGEAGLREVLGALPEPAAAVSLEGRVAVTNAAWRSLMGDGARLPRDTGLYAAFGAARRGEAGECRVTGGGGERPARIVALNDRLFLIRLGEPNAHAEPEGQGKASRPAVAPRAAPAMLDVLASAAPFGAALLDGPDPFTAKVVQANPALEAMAKGKRLLGHSLAHLIDPASRKEAAERLGQRGGPVDVKLVGEPPRTAVWRISFSPS